MIYEVEKFESCPVIGSTDILVSWDIGKGIHTEKRFFHNEANAFHYILGEIKEAIFSRYRDYIKRCRNLYEGGNGVYHTIAKDQAFDFFRKTLNDLWEKDLHAMLRNIEALRDKLHQILPGEKHSYYPKLHDEVIEICAFAKAFKSFDIDKLTEKEVAA